MPIRPLIIITDRDGREEYLGEVVSQYGQKIYAIVLRNISDVKVASAKLWQVCREQGVLLIAHGDAGSLKFCDGVRLNAKSKSIKQMREQYDDGLVIGYSAHSAKEAKQALHDGANYVFLSPVFKSKDGLSKPIGVDAFNKAVEELGEGVFALGGVDQTNVHLITKKASGFACISAVFNCQIHALL